MNDERYLWDRSDDPNTAAAHEVRELERLLGRYGHGAADPATQARTAVRAWRWSAAVAACALLGVALWFAQRGAERDESGPDSAMRLAVVGGRTLAADAQFVATATERELTLGTVGALDLAPGSRLRVKRVDTSAARLFLASGKLTAKVDPSVPARYFGVETPHIDCVDLGCAYVLEVDPDGGETRVRVTQGQVAFERDGASAYVPKGAVCVAAERRIGTPHFADCAPAIARLVAAFDAETDPGRRERLAMKLSASIEKPRDTLTLWHLLQSEQSTIVETAEARLVRIAGHPHGAIKVAPMVNAEEWREHLMELWWE